MDKGYFIKWLDNRFSKGDCIPPSLERLNSGEKLLAGRLMEMCEKARSYETCSKIYLQALNGTEGFYDMSIRALSALIKIGKLGEEVKNINALCNNALEVFSRELDFENCSIMLKDEANEHLVLTAGKGKGDKYFKIRGTRGKKTKIGEGVAGQAAKTGEYIFISDVTKDARFKPYKTKVEITSLLSVPLKSENEIIGVINFSHPLLEAFDENRINLMLLLSNFVGQMIMLTKLHNRIADWNETLKTEVRRKTHELRKKNKELQKMAVTDSLTDLYNRRFFATRLEEEFSRASRYGEHFSLLIIDLDNLKVINDTYGHPAGDKVIKELAKVLKKLGRKGDVIARIGGDEFGYIMIEAYKRDASAFAKRIKENLGKVKINDLNLKPAVSIGIAHSMTKYKRHQEIYRAADDSLYTEKKKKHIR